MMLTTRQKPDLQRFSGSGDGTPGEARTQAPDAGVQQELSLEMLLKQNPALKAQYDARVKRAIQGRFRNMKAGTVPSSQGMPEARDSGNTPKTGERVPETGKTSDAGGSNPGPPPRQGTRSVLEALASRYGMSWEPDNQEALLRALEQDNPPLTREQALENLRQQVALIQTREPGFRLEKAMGNPRFGQLVARGVPVLYAWLLTRQKQDMTRAMGYAIDRTRKAMTDQLRAGGIRPREAGGRSTQAAAERPDPGAMTPKERKALRQRVARGEKVYW